MVLMPVVERSALVAYSAKQMFELVDDVAAYPEFLPWCVDSEELARDSERVDARLKVSKGPFQNSFSTRNARQHHDKISIELLDGPFRYLKGCWIFLPLREDACKVTLNLDFEFSSKTADIAFGRLFGETMVSMIDAFTKQATQKYGTCNDRR
jgi:ribosome-associated toxin RatA of RatAB toxin-antitoxin module